eukprot:COSAG04_NODE_23182_length_342_cov_1.061728_1_plen_106_part_01
MASDSHCRCRSFLDCCFVKRPEDRATARELLEHPWITTHRDAAPEKIYTERVVGIGMGSDGSATKQADGEDGSLRAQVAAELLCPVLKRPMHDAIALHPCGDSVSE